MLELPPHGRVDCTRCFRNQPVEFDKSKLEKDGWRITSNPLAWGNPRPETIVLGFSKGPTQAGALASAPHDQVAYRGSRKNVGKVLIHVGLLAEDTSKGPSEEVDKLIAKRDGKFHFASLIRCTVERYDLKSGEWKGSGGGMLDRFLETEFGNVVASNCGSQYLRDLPSSVRLVLMFGLGTNLNYVRSAYTVFQKARPGSWRMINDIAYSDDKITVVHVEHFASQGALLPNWLGVNKHERSRLGLLARKAVHAALA